MKKILLGSSALIAAGLFAYTASAKVEFNLAGSVSGHAAYGNLDLDIKDTTTKNNKPMIINTGDNEFKDNGGKEVVNFSIWTEGELNGEVSTVSANGITYKGHFRIFDGSDGRADIYVSASGSFGNIFVGDRNFSDEIMMDGGLNYDIDDTGGYGELVEDYTTANTGSSHSYLPNFVEPVADTDLADGTVNRLMYISPNLLGGSSDTGLHVGGYVALTDDQTDEFDHKWVSDREFSDGLVYGAGLSYETNLAGNSSVLVDASLQMAKSAFSNSEYYSDKADDTILYRVGAKYTLGNISIKGYWGYKEQDVGEVSWTDTGANSNTLGTTFFALTHSTAHTFDVGAEYVMGAFTYGVDVVYTMADIDAYGGTPGDNTATPIVNNGGGSYKKMDDNDTSDYLGLGAGVSIALLDGVTLKAVEARYVHSTYSATDGSFEDILNVKGQGTDYELNYVSVSTGLEIEF